MAEKAELETDYNEFLVSLSEKFGTLADGIGKKLSISKEDSETVNIDLAVVIDKIPIEKVLAELHQLEQGGYTSKFYETLLPACAKYDTNPFFSETYGITCQILTNIKNRIAEGAYVADPFYEKLIDKLVELKGKALYTIYVNNLLAGATKDVAESWLSAIKKKGGGDAYKIEPYKA